MKYIKLYEDISKPKKKIGYRRDGSVKLEQWHLNGNLHREDGPALIHYYTDGSVEEERWSLNGKLHREDGPALIKYRPDGSVEWERLYLNGKQYDNEEDVWLAKMGLL